MSIASRQSLPGTPAIRPLVLGTLYCMVSALGYTATNMCLCSLASAADPVWTLWVKESVAVAVAGPWVLYYFVRGGYALPSLKVVAVLGAVGMAVQWLGNLGLQNAFGVLGLAVTVPVVYAVSLAGTAILGRAVLGEAVTLRSALAIASLIVAITLLSLSADGVSAVSVEGLGKARWALAATCLAGMVYAVMTISIRKSLSSAVPFPLVFLIFPAMGTLTLGPLGLWRDGVQGMLGLAPGQLGLMLLAGAFNLLAFLAYSQALRMITAVRANVINAAQVAMATVGGVLFFSEPPSHMLLLGVALTILGIFLIEQPASGKESSAAGEGE